MISNNIKVEIISVYANFNHISPPEYVELRVGLVCHICSLFSDVYINVDKCTNIVVKCTTCSETESFSIKDLIHEQIKFYLNINDHRKAQRWDNDCSNFITGYTRFLS